MSELLTLKNLRSPAVVAAFSGWNDASEAATGVIEHLIELTQARVVFSIDPEEFYDFQVNRPTLSRANAGDRTIEWPTTEVLVAELPERDLVLIIGPEPNLRWPTFCRRLISALRTVQPEVVILVGAFLTDSPHSRPVPVTGTVSDPGLARQRGLEESEYEGPTGIVGVLAAECAIAGMQTASLWASVPHYVSEPPNPKATLALLGRLEDLLDAPLDVGELPQMAAAWEQQVSELAAEDSEVSAYITALEERRDENLHEPSGDDIAAEFQRYLRRREPDG